jgi:glycosyltransferase involved in cell wall biosynthesis
MRESFAIVTPAHTAQPTLPATVKSVLAQTNPDWRLYIVADDGFDYLGLLEDTGLSDPRITILSSGGIGRGASHARNVALDIVEEPYVAILDADDRFKPEKLANLREAFATHAIVTCALDVMTEDFRHLRFVGTGESRPMPPGAHKWTSLSMDSMVAWDRRKTDARYDPALSNMTDLELLLQLYQRAQTSFHFGLPLHDYVKRASSMSNGKNVAEGMIRSKTEIHRRLRAGHYALARADIDGVVAFLDISLEAERSYEAALAARPGLLFEDHIEPMLRAARPA